jgi:DUF2075 family protein
MWKRNPAAAQQKADAIIRNTYRTLMTRGMKGCDFTSPMMHDTHVLDYLILLDLYFFLVK